MRRALALALPLAFALSALADDAQLKVKEGEPFPDVRLPVTAAAGSKTWALSDVRGKKNVVLFFYPKAMTPGCTVESCGYRDLEPEFAKLDTVVVGISVDPLTAQEKFTEKENLNFPLLADADGAVTRRLGVLGKGGKASQRVTFVIDKEGVLRKAYTKVTPKSHPKEALDFVRENLK